MEHLNWGVLAGVALTLLFLIALVALLLNREDRLMREASKARTRARWDTSPAAAVSRSLAKNANSNLDAVIDEILDPRLFPIDNKYLRENCPIGYSKCWMCNPRLKSEHDFFHPNCEATWMHEHRSTT